MPAPRTSAPSTTTGSDALPYLLFGVLGAGIAFDSLAWLTGKARPWDRRNPGLSEHSHP
ncbi:hypothetical protein [Streptomyces sp. NPDC001820]|uniref:hypothetical protein n=1 Tax=Streptomyces sp. NPDC001820 TaxID=3364613 RepID=UPI00368710C2